MATESEHGKRTVFIVDQHPTVRAQLAALIQREADLEVCGDAADASAVFSVISRREPDLIVLDISSTHSCGLDSLRSLMALRPKLRVLALSMQDSRLHAERVLKAGAMGFMTKQEATVNILSAIRSVLEGQGYPTPANSPATAGIP
jgi:DNA-binding NarL/FixJ family response regulator